MCFSNTSGNKKMESILNYYNFVLEELSDPRVRHWTLMDSPGPTLFIILVYIFSVLLVLPAYMQNRKPYNLTKIIRYYNIFQIVSCSSIIYTMATAGWTTGEYSFGCQPVDYSENPNAVRLIRTFYWVYLLKMIELTETVFFILRKKFNQVTGLHVYHHSSTFLLAYIGCKFVGGGMTSLVTMLNCFIHILMYSYYYLSSFGPNWQKILAPWKRRLTIVQMIQFTILIVHSLTALSPDCNVPKRLIFIWLPNIVVNYKMFYDFYIRSYVKNVNKLS